MKSIFQVLSFDLLSKILMGIIGILLIRYMKPNEYAIYTFASSIIIIIAQTLSSAFRRIYIVGYDRFELKKVKESFLGLQFFIIVLIFLIPLFFVQNFNIIYFLIINMVIGYTLFEFSKTVYQQSLNFRKFSFIEISKSITFFLLTIILVFFLEQKITAWQILMIQSLIMIIMSLLALRNKVNFKRVLNIRKAFYIGKQIITGHFKYLLGYLLFTTLLSNIDIFMLKFSSNNIELSTYGSAFRYYTLLLLTLNSVNTVFLPVIQNINCREELEEIYNKHAKMLMIFIPVVLLGAWLSKWIIPFIDMGKYPDSVIVFQLLSISAIFSFAFSPHMNLIMKFEDFKFLYFIAFISLCANIILNIIMIPLYGAIGAAIATLITFGFSNFMTYYRSNQLRKYKF